ncbi:MAG: NusG domain II-containing protein [Treponema sp.]|nr:NusG domain II-containing protein [Treponema sp.]
MLQPLDLAVAILLGTLTILSGAAVYSGGGEETVTVKGPGGRWVFPRSAAETLHISGPLGETVVELKDGRARVLSSPCANQTCVAAGAIHSRGRWIACLPNQVLVSISGEAEVDGAAW